MLPKVYEEIPVPSVPATGFLVKILAAGGTLNFSWTSWYRDFVPECLSSSIQIADSLQVCHSDWSLLKTERNFPHYHDVYTLVSVSTSHCFFVELHLVEHW